MRDEPVQDYFPGALVRLIVRFEDFGSKLLPPPPKKLPQQMRGAGKDAVLSVSNAGGKYALRPKSGSKSSGGSPQQQTTSSDNFTHEIGGIIPISATLKLQGIREGNRLTLELPFASFPFDPRAIRSVGVEFYLGTISPEAFGRGANSSDLNVIPYEYTDEAKKRRTNRRFQGWVDDIEVDYPDDDEPIVRLECSDNSRLLAEQIAPPGLSIDSKKPIDEAIANYLANFPQFRGLNVEYRPAGVAPPKLGEALAKTAFRPKLGPPPSKGGDSKLTVFDYVVDVAGALGHVAYIDDSTVVIQQPHTKYSNRFDGRPDDPFTGRILPSGIELKNRLLIYGRNLETMNIRRKFTKASPTNIEIRSYHGARKKTLVARYPIKGDRVLRALPGESTDQKWQVVRVRGIKDEKTLRIIAQTYYEMQGRNEIQIRVTTQKLASFGGGNADPDLLDLKAGDPIDIGIARDLIYTAGVSEEETTSDAERFLLKLGYSKAFAKGYAASVNNIGLPKTFRVRNVQYDWSSDEGITIDIDLINYIEVKSDKLLPTGEQIEVPELGATPTKVKVEE